MVADLFSLLAQTASPKGEAEKGGIAQSASTEREAGKGTKDNRGVGKGKAGKRLVRRLEQTSSVCLRRQLPRRGEAEKGRIAQSASTERKTEKGTKDSRGVGKGKAERTGTIPRRAGIKIDEVYIHIRLRMRGNRFRKAIL